MACCRDYRVDFRYGQSGIAVMAPHGGRIEPGTTEIADAAAGTEHNFYSFTGLKMNHNRNLHLTSSRFDEPEGIRMAEDSETVLSIHGCKAQEKIVYTGGRNITLRTEVNNLLCQAGFPIDGHSRYPGVNPMNICNRSRQSKGVQIEVSLGLRLIMFRDLARANLESATVHFEKFVTALRNALSTYRNPLTQKIYRPQSCW